MKHFFKLGVIGFGNMAEAILSGAVNSKVCTNDEICIYDVITQKMTDATTKGFAVVNNIAEIIQKSEYVLLSVKPQSIDDVFNSIKGSLNNNIFVSIMAGISKEKIHNSLPGVKVCRCMPNTPLLIGKGITAIDTSEIPNEKDFIIKLFSSTGKIVEISESYMNAVTAVSGSGPAYVYKFINAYITAAKNLGLNEEQSRALVISTVIGAAEMVKLNSDINILIEKVCSKGGTTIEGVNILNNNNFDEIVNSCVKAAYNRAEELSKL